MKKAAIASVLIIASLFYVGCKKRSTVEFDVTYSTDFIMTPTTVTVGLNKIPSNGWVTTGMGTKLDNNNINGNLVGEIKITDFNLTVKSSSGVKLAKNKNYDFYIVAGEQNPVRVANCSPWFGASTTTLQTTASSSNTNPALVTMKITEANLKNYFLESRINMTMHSWTDNLPTTTYTLTADYKVHVKAIEQ